MKKKKVIISVVVVVIILILLIIFNQPLIIYSDSMADCKIYSNGIIKIVNSNTNLVINKKIEVNELEKLKKLIYNRYKNNDAIDQSEGINVDQYWSGTAFYNYKLIPLNYNFSEPNKELVMYINELVDKYLVE